MRRMSIWFKSMVQKYFEAATLIFGTMTNDDGKLEENMMIGIKEG